MRAIFANSGASWKSQLAPKLEISNFLLIRAPVFLTIWRNSDEHDATRKLRKILEIQALMAFIELKKTQKTRDIGSPKSNAAVTDIKSSISRTLDRISSLDTTASNINRSLYNLSEARKVQDMVADMAYLRMNHMDKILSSNFSDR